MIRNMKMLVVAITALVLSSVAAAASDQGVPVTERNSTASPVPATATVRFDVDRVLHMLAEADEQRACSCRARSSAD